MGSLKVVVGGQNGSEAKGRVVQWLAQNAVIEAPTAVMRVGGPNAGHCVEDAKGTLFKLRQMPVGAVVEGVDCLIGAGSEVNPDILQDEIHLLAEHGHTPAITVDAQATMLDQRHIDQESDRAMNDRLGSTQSGTGAARAARVWREASIWQGGGDTAEIARRVLRGNGTVIVEGVQGLGLGLHYGHYPQCTSIDCRAIDMLSLAGLSPWDESVTDLEVWVVLRTRPIRVAGNSGPLNGETDWETIGQEPEITTVTKRVRRVGEWDPELARQAVIQNGGARSGRVKVWLSMIDYEVPGIKGLDGPIKPGDWPSLDEWSSRVLRDTGVRPSVFGTGPSTSVWYDWSTGA